MTATAPRVIATGTLIRLREKTIDDAERDYSWRKDPELAEYDAARPISMPLKNFIATLNDDLHYPSSYRRTFAIEDIATGTHIGNVMYYSYDPMLGEAELGITIGNRDYWSHGFGTDTMRTMLRYLFDEKELRRVYLHTLSWNYRAQTAFTRAGFHQTRHVRRDGYDFEQMEVLREEWTSLGTESSPGDRSPQ